MAIAVADRGEFYDRLASIRHVVHVQRLVVWFLRLVSAALVTDVALLLSVRLFPVIIPSAAFWAPQLALVVAGLLIAAITLRPRDALVAAFADHELRLRERLTTALENQEQRHSGWLVQAQLDDALRHLRRVEPWQSFPIRFPRRERRAALLLAIMVGILAMAPNPMKETLQRRALVQRTLRQEAAKIEKVADDVRQDELADKADEQQRIAQTLSDLAQLLQRQGVSPEEALASIAQAQQRLAELRNPRGESAQDALDRATAALAREPLTREVASNVQKGDYQQAAEKLNQLGQRAQDLSQQERDRAAAALRAAGASAAKADSQLGSSLQEAGDALDSQQDSGEMGRVFQRASSQMAQAGQAARSQGRQQRAQSQLDRSRDAISQMSDQSQGRDASARSQQGSAADASSSDQGQQQAQQGQGAGQPQAGDSPGEDTMRQPGQGQSGSPNGSKSPGDSPGGQGQGERIYSAGYTTHQEGVQGQSGDSGAMLSGSDSSLSDPTSNDSQVPYVQVLGNYQQKATKAMDSSYVPLNMKELVKDYFSSLAPNQSQK